MPDEQGPKPPGYGLRNRTQAPHSLHLTDRLAKRPLVSEMNPPAGILGILSSVARRMGSSH